MNYIFVLLASVANSQSPACAYDPGRDEFLGGNFPEDFIWSVATASYQIEGSWNVDGKGENIWDRFSHNNNPDTGQCNVKDCATGDVACDSYQQRTRDIEQLKKMGIKV